VYSRIISLIIAIIYLIAGATDGLGAILKIMIFLALPLTCIWYGDAMGNYTGIMRMQSITTKTPGCFIRFMGWVLLLIPIAVAFYHSL